MRGTVNLLPRSRRLDWPPSGYGKLLLSVLRREVDAGRLTARAAAELSREWFGKGST
jgi:hypothetical protein